VCGKWVLGLKGLHSVFLLAASDANLMLICLRCGCGPPISNLQNLNRSTCNLVPVLRPINNETKTTRKKDICIRAAGASET